jgi:hypothetical protein
MGPSTSFGRNSGGRCTVVREGITGCVGSLPPETDLDNPVLCGSAVGGWLSATSGPGCWALDIEVVSAAAWASSLGCGLRFLTLEKEKGPEVGEGQSRSPLPALCLADSGLGWSRS